MDNRVFREGDLTYTVDISSKSDTDSDFVLRRGAKELLRTPLRELSASVSVVWSDDHKSFAVTWSDSGAAGGYHVRAFQVQGDSVTELPVTEKAWGDFRKRHWCETRGDNIEAYDWMPTTGNLVLVLSVFPTSDCGNEMGYTEGYVVDRKTGAILNRWSGSRLEAYIRAHPEGDGWTGVSFPTR